jgi:hypothetical protein
VYKRAANELTKNHEQGNDRHEPRPGLAEYLDLLRAVLAITPDNPDRQIEALKRISCFVRDKQAVGDY